MVDGFAKTPRYVLLQPQDIPPSHCRGKVIGVFNPAVAKVGDELVMLARVAECPIEERSGWTAIPRWSSTGDAQVDWVRDEDLMAAMRMKTKCSFKLPSGTRRFAMSLRAVGEGHISSIVFRSGTIGRTCILPSTSPIDSSPRPVSFQTLAMKMNCFDACLSNLVSARRLPMNS